MNINSGDVVLVRDNHDEISKLIEEITDSQYSHTAGYIQDGKIIEAEGFRKTGYQNLNVYNSEADIFTCDIATNEQRQGIVDYLKSQIGGTYDYFLLFLELIRYVFGVMLPYKEKPRVKICSVLISDAYRSVGIDLCLGIRYPSPCDISESKLLRKIGSI